MKQNLSSVSPKQLCELAHLRCIRETGTVEPGSSKALDSKLLALVNFFAAYQLIYNINHLVDSKLLPILERGSSGISKPQNHKIDSILQIESVILN